MRSAVLSRRCGAGLAIRSLVSQRQYCDSRKEWCHAVLPTRCVKSIGAISVALLTQMAPGVGKRSLASQSHAHTFPFGQLITLRDSSDDSQPQKNEK